VRTGVHVAGIDTDKQRVLLPDDHLDYSSLVLALGGGVIGDLTGLAASLLRRGVGIVSASITANGCHRHLNTHLPQAGQRCLERL